MGRKKNQHLSPETESSSASSPRLASRRQNQKSTFKMGRTIGEKRERLETANERAAARKKDKKKQAFRVSSTTIGFILLILVLLFLGFLFVGNGDPKPIEVPVEKAGYEPTIPITDEDSPAGQHITSRMKSYIGQAERDFRDLGLTPARAVIPAGSIREVDFYLEGRPGFIKMTLDRDTAVSVEDAERMLRYLASIGVENFSYIDVRLDQKAFWK